MAREEVSRAAPAKASAPANSAGNRRKTTNSQKAKKKNPSNLRSSSAHPTYLEMIGEAVTSLKERTGSSQYAITKFIEDKHKSHLPSNFSKLLLVQLRKFVASGKLTKVKNSYKLPAKTKKPSVTEPTKTKPKSAVAAKSKVKATAVAKPKAAVKVSKPKPKTVAEKSNNRPAKVAKTSAKQTPGKKVAASNKTVAAPKKQVAKTTKKVKSGNSAVKVPVKKALARKA
ncbi:histone H1-like [Phalaenopsis equestris]|uniref:histone H1-like n=1 Tax=Phalaenopsis equestris TaxID=78828 RepID=UPI0009E4BF5F|nr:histone H1-like [Phalaenopsis equestris]